MVALVALGCGDHEGSGPMQLPDASPAPDASSCQGLACAQVTCAGGGTTSISGTVMMPNGTMPLANATVYVPRGAVAPISPGVSCDRCSAGAGEALVRTTSDGNGHFVLPNMPATRAVPVVIQIGKWRRQLQVQDVPACVDTAVDPGLTRLPRNQSEGDLPQMAVSTGERDAFECMLRKLGIDDRELTVPGGGGRVHLFAGFGGSAKFDAAHGGATFPLSTTLWASEASLSAYDVVFLACEGDPRTQTKPAAALAAMKAYADKGGRVFASHWHNYWLSAGPAPWNDVLTINSRTNLGPISADVDPDLARTKVLATWLVNVGASTTSGKLPVLAAQHTMVGLNPLYAERWIHLDTNSNGVPSVQLASMTTPLEAASAQKCGRVVVSDVHASTVDQSAAYLEFPSGGCTTDRAQLTPQEKMLAFMVFDLAACIDVP